MFLNFFRLEFSITHWVGTKRNANLYFLSFSAFSNQFLLEKKPKLYFLNFWTYLQFLMNFLLRVGLERNGMIIFIFPVSQSIPTYYGMKWSHNGSFYYSSGWNGTERYFLFSLFLNVSPLILAWNEAVIVFYNFLNFFAFFLEFSITCHVRTV